MILGFVDYFGTAEGESGTMQYLYKLAASIGGQASASAFNFLLNIILIRSLQPHDFGIFALVLIVAYFVIGIANALSIGPIAIYLPGIRSRLRMKFMTLMFIYINSLIVVASVLIMTGGMLIFAADLPLALCAGLLVGAMTARQFYRGMGFARRLPNIYLGSDLIFVAGGLALVVVPFELMENGMGVPLIFLFLAIANLAASVITARAMTARILVPPRTSYLKHYRLIWRDLRWSLLGVVVWTLRLNAHSFIITYFAGAAAFAPLAAASTVFRPVGLIVTACRSVILPDIAQFHRENKIKELHQSTWRMVKMLVAVSILYVAAVYFSFDILYEKLFYPKYDKDVVALAVSILGVITIVAGCGDTLSVALGGMRAFRDLFFLGLAGTIVSVTMVTAILFLRDAPTTLVGILCGELISVLLMGRYLRRKHVDAFS